MFTATVEYALYAMAQLASENAAFSTVQQIAKKTQISSPYLAKVFMDLGKAGLITAQRGRNGGIKLAKPAHRISLLDVVAAVGPLNFSIAPRHGSAKSSLGRLDARLDSLQKTLRKQLATVTLAEAYTGGSRPKRKQSLRIT
jgi:Rrf2 family protein